MSDIYLQITETPTVVTLSAPVVSGALAATVTVANVVSVNVVTMPSISVQAPSVTTVIGSVTLGASTAQIGSVTASISGTVPVSGTFYQATQPVSLASVPAHAVTLTSTTVTVSSLPALAAGTAQIGSVTASISGTVPVSGTFYQATQPVSGTFWQATQPVSLASVPAHAVTLTSTTVTVSSLPALAAGTAQIGSVTASISGTVPVSGTFYQATQPVSLASVPTHGVTLSSTTVTVSSLPAISGTVTISALPRPTWTNYSGTVATANTVITAISTTTRSYLLAQVTTGQMFLNIGATATSLNSVYFAAGQGFAWETSVPQGFVSIISAVTGTNYVLKEG
jgi:hypothetical protein